MNDKKTPLQHTEFDTLEHKIEKELASLRSDHEYLNRKIKIKDDELRSVRLYSRIFQSVFLIIAFIFISVFLIFFTTLGEWLGVTEDWFIPDVTPDPNAKVNSNAIVAATRNMISILGPIVIGITIWVITSVAERRLKTYDESIQTLRESLETRLDAFRAETRERLRDEGKDTAIRLDAFSERLTDAPRDIQASITDDLQQRINELVSTSVKENIEAVRKSTTLVLDEVNKTREDIEARFGHIADSVSYSKADSNIIPITSVGPIHNEVTRLFKLNKRADAINLVLELLNRFKKHGDGLRPLGSLGDWFNLSAQLGREDEEALALEICLAALEQQNGAPIFDKNNKANWRIKNIQPHDSLMAHAIQYGNAINDSRVLELIKLTGYDPITRTGHPGWGWRSYNFTMSALANFGRFEEAKELGENYMKNITLDADANKVIQSIAGIIDQQGERQKAISLSHDWLRENPDVPAPQVITQLLEWGEGALDPEEIIELTNRAVRDLAERQPSSAASNIYHHRALAYDFMAVDGYNKGEDKDMVLDHISKALRDFRLAAGADINPGLTGNVALRTKTLQAIRAELDPSFEDKSEDISIDNDSDPRTRMLAILRQIVPALSEDTLSDEQRAGAINTILDGEPDLIQTLVKGYLGQMRDEDDTPDELKEALVRVLPLL